MKTRHIRALTSKMAILASAVTLAAGFALLGPSAGASAATCSGYTCHGHDPEIYGCTATTTITTPVDYKGVQVATLWNRYSSACKANWARAQLTTAGLNAHDQFWIYIYTTDSTNHQEVMCFPGPPDNSGEMNELDLCGPTYGGSEILYTDMVDGTNKTYAVIDVVNSSGGGIASGTANQ